MKVEYLVDPNEAEDAADHYLREFRKRGVSEGSDLSLVVHITGIEKSKLAAVEADVLRLYECAHVERGERGMIFKKATLAAYLKPIRFERQYLLKAARALYRLILDHEVTVEIKLA